MAVRTVYTCDRCGDEVRSATDLRPFTARLGQDLQGAAGTGDDVTLDGVCRQCGSMLLSVIRSAIENHGAVE